MLSTPIRRAVVSEIKFHSYPPSREGWGSQENIGHVSNYKTPAMLFFLLHR